MKSDSIVIENKEKRMFFTNETLRAMIIPLFLEQLLVMLVGLADTFVVSFVGEAAVSGVSLVNSFNTIFIYLFTALASGGAVVVSQYIGRKWHTKAKEGISQLLMISVFFFAVSFFMYLAFWQVIVTAIVWSCRKQCYGCMHYLFTNIGIFLSCISCL